MMFTAEELYTEAMRELKMRERVYAGQVQAGAMSPDLAEKRIAMMRQIADDYAKQAEGERLI